MDTCNKNKKIDPFPLMWKTCFNYLEKIISSNTKLDYFDLNLKAFIFQNLHNGQKLRWVGNCSLSYMDPCFTLMYSDQRSVGTLEFSKLK